MAKANPALFEIENLHVVFDTFGGIVQAVQGVSLSVAPGKTLAVVGESGCGKSATFQAAFGLIPTPPGRITAGKISFKGKSLFDASAPKNVGSWDEIRGRKVGFIFQDPMTSLNPTMRVGDQIGEVLLSQGYSKKQATEKTIELLQTVNIPDPAERLKQYPFQFSGGMRQRVMIAMALAGEPDLLVADEPTTALDVTIQSQILSLLKKLQQERSMAIVLITHDLGVVAQMADEVAVMYAGQIVESGTTRDVLAHSAHPYTIGLKHSLPERSPGKRTLSPIPGFPPDLFSPPSGCAFASRCPQAMRLCQIHEPGLIGSNQKDHQMRCWLGDREVQKILNGQPLNAHKPLQTETSGVENELRS